jgi:hypothetical protein
MFTKIDKAYVAAAVSFLSLTAMQFFGFELDTSVQAGIVAVVTAVMTWAVPNKKV